MHCTATVRTHPLRQAASTVRYTCGDDEEVLAAGVCPAPLSEVAGRQERVHRHSVEQIVDFVPVVQILDGPVPQMVASIPAVLEQVIVPPLPEVHVVGRVADFVTPRTLHWSLRKRREDDDEVEEDVLEMFDESIDWLEHSRWLPWRLCRPFMAGRCEDGWGCTFAHGEQQLHPSTLRGAERGRASAADHG